MYFSGTARFNGSWTLIIQELQNRQTNHFAKFLDLKHFELGKTNYKTWLNYFTC